MATDTDETLPVAITGPVHVFATDTMTLARNAATNARWFSAMVFAANLLAFGLGHGALFGRLAALSALGVGLAVLLDQLPTGPMQQLSALAVYALPVAALLLFFSNIG